MMAFLTHRLTGIIAVPLAFALAVALIAVSAISWSRGKTIDAQATRVSELERDKATLKLNNQDLQRALDDQNDAVDRLKRDGDDLRGRAERFEAEADRAAERDRDRARAITNERSGADKCASAADLIREYAR